MSNAFWGGIAFTLFSLYFVKYALTSFRYFRESRSWPSVDGTIRDCVLRVSETSNTLRFFNVQYEYQVDGEKYSNNRIALYTIVQKAEAESLAETFQPGATVPVYYAPDQPKTSCLVPGPPTTKKYSDLILATLALGVGIATTVAGYYGVLK